MWASADAARLYTLSLGFRRDNSANSPGLLVIDFASYRLPRNSWSTTSPAILLNTPSTIFEFLRTRGGKFVPSGSPRLGSHSGRFGKIRKNSGCSQYSCGPRMRTVVGASLTHAI